MFKSNENDPKMEGPISKSVRHKSRADVGMDANNPLTNLETARLDRVTKRVVAPYAKIVRRSVKGEEELKAESYIDLSKFKIFLEDEFDMESLLYDTAVIFKDVSKSSGVFVYKVNKGKNEIVLITNSGIDHTRHEVNIPIGKGKVLAAHVAETKECLHIEDVPRDNRFAEGLKWIDAQVAVCAPVVKQNGECAGVIEFYRTYPEPYDEQTFQNISRIAWWAGEACYQSIARLTIQKTSYLNTELLKLMKHYFSELVSLDTMITDMLSLIKSYMKAMRSSFYIIIDNPLDEAIKAVMWDDGWSTLGAFTVKKSIKVNLSEEQTPAGYVARNGGKLNLVNVYKDTRFIRDVDPVTGTIVRNVLVSSIEDKKNGVIAVVQLCNRNDKKPFDSEDEEVFDVFMSYCTLIVYFNKIYQKEELHENFNLVFAELMSLHLKPCKHDIEESMETSMFYPPSNFKSFEYYLSEDGKDEMPGLLYYMFTSLFDESKFDRHSMMDFFLTVISCYRDNSYHNSEHAYCFTHTMFVILMNNRANFDFVEALALMLGGLCHDLDHPGYNNNFLTLSKHPLSKMYKTSTLEYHHYYMGKKLVHDKNILAKLSATDQARLLNEMKYNILCTDLAIYFQIRAQLTPVIANHNFDWTVLSHRNMLKAILMTTSDLSGTCKPFGISKRIAAKVYNEFYRQGDMEREMGYTPLSIMDRRRRNHQPAEQIQFLSVVVIPCLVLCQSVLPNISPLLENCTKTLESWHEEIDIRGQKLWRQDDSTTLIRSKCKTSTAS